MNPSRSEVLDAETLLWKNVPVGTGRALNVLVSYIENLEYQLGISE